MIADPPRVQTPPPTASDRAVGLELAWRQYRLERRLFWRNPSAAFFNFLLPLLFLVAGGIILSGNQDNLDKLVPSIAGMSVMSTTFTALAYNIVFLRERGRAQADPRHADADDLLLRRGRRQRGHEHRAPDRDRGRRRTAVLRHRLAASSGAR